MGRTRLRGRNQGAHLLPERRARAESSQVQRGGTRCPKFEEGSGLTWPKHSSAKEFAHRLGGMAGECDRWGRATPPPRPPPPRAPRLAIAVWEAIDTAIF